MSKPIGIVESLKHKDDTSVLATRVAPSFMVCAQQYGFEEINDGNYRLWLVDLLLSGRKFSTVRRYATAMRIALADEVALSDSFADDAALIKALCDNDKAPKHDNFRYISRLLNSTSTIGWLTLYLLYNPAVSLAQAIMLKQSDLKPGCAQIDETIVNAGAKPQAKYVFPLGQGKKRACQIERETLSEIRKRLENAGMRFDGSFSRADITGLWIDVALSRGLSPELVRAVVGELPARYACLDILAPRTVDEEKKATVIANVAQAINDNVPRWFAMKLRDNNTPDDITAALPQGIAGKIEFYYPCRKERRNGRKGKRTVEVPFLPGILFFRYRRDKIPALFRNIGNMAWCFRTSGAPDSPYSVISDSAMMQFQRHIGLFSPDMEMRLTNLDGPAVGDHVRVSGNDIFSGYEGTVIKIRKDEDGGTTYILQLSALTAISWKEVSVRSPFVEPA